MSQQFKCGNCSDWIGYGLQKVGLVDDISMLPVTPQIDHTPNQRCVCLMSHVNHIQKILWIKMYQYFLQAEVKIPFRYVPSPSAM
jgi:hypothetical protein